MFEEIQENDERGMLKIRQTIATRRFKSEECSIIIDKIMKRIPKDFNKYLPSTLSHQYDEILRRFSVLTRPFVTICAHKIQRFHQILNFTMSAAELLTWTIKLMKRRLVIVPGFGQIDCSLVHRRMAETVLEVIDSLKNQHLERIRKERVMNKSKNRGIIHSHRNSVIDNPHDKNAHVAFDEIPAQSSTEPKNNRFGNVYDDTEMDENKRRRVSFHLSADAYQDAKKEEFKRRRARLLSKVSKDKFVSKMQESN